MSGRRLLEVAVVAALVVGYALVHRAYLVPVIGGSDANGYLMCARMFADHGRFHQLVTDPFSFVGQMWVFQEHGVYYPKYPPLLGLLVGTVMRVFGDDAGFAVNSLAAAAAVAGVYVLCRSRLPAWAAVLAAVAAATNPVLNSFAVRQHSHALSTACVTWSFALLLWATRRKADRWSFAMLLGSGFALGYSMGVRYPNALLAAAALFWLLAFRRDRRWPRTAAWLGGFAVPCGFLAFYHWTTFGSPLRTAYALTHEQTGFRWFWIVKHVKDYLPGLATHGVGPWLALSGAGWLGLWLHCRREGIFFTLWMLPLALVYMAYYWLFDGQEVIYMRFFLPLLPALLLLAMLFVQELRGRFADDVRRWRWGVAGLLLVQLVWGVPLSLAEMEQRYALHDRMHRRIEFVREHVPSGAAVISEINLIDSLSFDQRYTLYWSEILAQDALRYSLHRALAGGLDSHQPARLQQWRDLLLDLEPEEFDRRIRGWLSERLAQGRLFLVAKTTTILATREAYRDSFELRDVAQLPGSRDRFVLYNPAEMNRVRPATQIVEFVQSR